MTFARNLWKSDYTQNSFGQFPCPRCLTGLLKLDKSTLKIEEPPYSKALHQEDDWDAEWVTERFICLLRCDNPKCEEIVTSLGDTSVDRFIVEDDDGSHSWDLMTVLQPRAIFPAPPIITIPKEVAKPIAGEIRKSFGLFWADRDACATKLRKSVEMVLDEFKIPRTTKTKKGKDRYLDLKERIEEFKNIDPNNHQALNALRNVGNLATHDGGVTLEALLDTFQVYEYALGEIFGKNKANIDKLIQKLISKKGKY